METRDHGYRHYQHRHPPRHWPLVYEILLDKIVRMGRLYDIACLTFACV